MIAQSTNYKFAKNSQKEYMLKGTKNCDISAAQPRYRLAEQCDFYLFFYPHNPVSGEAYA